MAESVDMRPVVEQVTRYIAERMIERQRMMDGEPETMKSSHGVLQAKLAEASTTHAAERSETGGIVAGLVWVLLGAVIGGGLLLLFLSGQLNPLMGR